MLALRTGRTPVRSGQRENKNKWFNSTLLPGLAAARGLTDSMMHSNANVVKEDELKF